MVRGDENEPGRNHETMVERLCRSYASALLFGDEIAAEMAIREALDAKLSTAEIELWERGELSVAEEHIATEISIRMLALQREAQRVAAARRDHRVMLGAPAGELHVIGLHMLGNLLRGAGYGVVMLGADVPPESLAAAARRHRPDVVCLTTTMPDVADRLLVTVEEVQHAWPAAGFVVGGRGVTARVRTRPRVDVCARVGEGVHAVDALVQRADLN
jgi:MerR family transcriptional regulator, light-induced transcriptional regulator